MLRPSLFAVLALASVALPLAASAGEIDCSRPIGRLHATPLELLAGRVWRTDEAGRLRPTRIGSAQRYALYYGASWCGPCRLFARKLRPVYESGDPSRLGYEVIFVSRDRSDGDARAYVALERMPWPAVALAEQSQPRELAAAGARHAPDLVVIDAQGRIYCSAHERSGRYRGAFETFTAMRASLTPR